MAVECARLQVDPAFGSFTDRLDHPVPVGFFLGEREQDVKDDWLEGEETVQVLGVHAAHRAEGNVPDRYVSYL
jgi:hypothetical protein